ncbi:MAG: hypothetical protein HY696_04500, partial [Deltaproteobacteria bacterium]|nr:hypothetical protein [Deltaproteobacteria bacterium]
MPIASAHAANVTIDSSTSTGARNNGTNPKVVFTTDQIGYIFYADSGGNCVYSKSTDGGANWGTAIQVDSANNSDCTNMAVWYDQWTPGDTSGTKIHVATLDSGADDIWYTWLDTNGDTLSTTANASDTNQGGTFAAGTNFSSITKGTDGDLYLGVQDGGDSFVLKCTGSCDTGSNWTEAGTSPFDLANDYLILLPLAGGNVMAIRRDVSADDVDSQIYTDSSNTWAGSWTDIDTSATENSTYDAAMGATVDKLTNDIYLAYVAQAATLGTDDDIRTAYYNGSWTAKTDVLTNDSKGLTGAKIEFDENNGDVYVVYTAQTTAGTASTGNVYYKKSTDGMVNWGAESSAINSSSSDLYGPLVNAMSNQRLYVGWLDGTNSDLIADTIADIAPPTVQFSSASSSGSEATTPGSMTVSLSYGSIQTVTVDYAVTGGAATGSGTDYTLASGTLTFTADQTSKTIDPTIVNDALDEANETIIVTLSNPTKSSLGATTEHTYTITDDDATPTLAVADVSVDEAAGTATVTVTMTGYSASTVTVDYATSNGTAIAGDDYTSASGTLTWTTGQTGDKTYTITIAEDALDENNETITNTLSNAANASISDATGTATITDNDASPSVAFSASSSNGAESATPATITIALSAVSGRDVTVDYALSGTATGSGTDYTLANGTATITAGSSSVNLSATIADDALDENDETMIVTLSNPGNASLGATTVHTYTITDNDATPTVAFTGTTGSGGEATTPGNMQLTLSAVSGRDVTVDYVVSGGTATGSGTDYTLASGTATITAGSTTTNIGATMVDDALDEANETIEVTISNPSNATLGANTIHTYTINDNDATPTLAVADVSVDEGAGTATVTVTMTGQSAS